MASINLKCHQLIRNDHYSCEYARIKKERGAPLVDVWTEKTDPRRYIYEDCGILAYILCVKRTLQLDFRCFVDLACGNGLLTYLLTAEGLKGCGIDARARDIWNKFRANNADLRKTSIDPSDVKCKEIPNETDFLIGNHPDELTPWIPVMAASKFNNKPTNEFKGGIGISKYDQYLNYIQSIGERLGFCMHKDKLKTSSSKRVCFIGTIPAEGLHPNREEIISQMLIKPHGTLTTIFKPIGDTIDPRNCTQLPFEFRQALSLKMAGVLLAASNERIGNWACGGVVHLADLSKHLTEDEKTRLKSQFGGLQTFLKNYSQTFQVRRAMVRLRRWPEEYVEFCKKPEKFKKSYCWFFSQHHQGCPLNESICPYIHAVMIPPQKRKKIDIDDNANKLAIECDRT